MNPPRAPTGLAVAPTVVVENQSGGIIGIVSASDPNPGETFTYEIVGGPHAAQFQIVDNQLMIGTDGLNFAPGEERALLIKVTDSSGLSSTFPVKVQLTSVATDSGDQVTMSFAVANGTIDLGGGTDTLTLANGTNRVTLQNTETVVGGAGTDSVTMGTAGDINVSGVEILFGSGGTDVVTMAAGGTRLSDELSRLSPIMK